MKGISQLLPNILFFSANMNMQYFLCKVYEFTVIARDGGKVPHEGFAKVIVTLIDVNDNNPVFEPTAYQVKVSKRTLIQTGLEPVLLKYELGAKTI